MLLVEDLLPLTSGVEVARTAGRLCPRTCVVGHGADAAALEVLRAAGAAEVFGRQVPPADVAGRVLTLMAADRPTDQRARPVGGECAGAPRGTLEPDTASPWS